MRTGRDQGQGFSLLELLIVVSLLGLIAAVATPALFSDEEARLDRAADQVVSAFRFAHAESIRTGQPHGISASMFGQYVRVYRLDDSVNPPVAVYDIRDPVSKQLYDLKFGGDSDPAVSFVWFKFENYFLPKATLDFAGSNGVPKYTVSGTTRMLETGYISLSHDGITRTIAVSPMTSRVTVQ